MSELYLPVALKNEIEAKQRRAKSWAERDLDFPVSFRRVNSGVPVGLGNQAAMAETLLKEQKGWADIALRALSDRVGGLDWFGGTVLMNEKGQRERTPLPMNHPLNEVLNRPNPLMSGLLARKIITRHVVQTGASYWQKLRDGAGITRELWPIPTQNIEPIAANGFVIGGYRVVGSDGIQYELDVDEVVRIWEPDVETLFGQRGRLTGQAVEYDASLFLGEHMRAFFQKDATPRVAIVGDVGVSVPGKDDMEAFLARWRIQNDRRLGTEIGLPAFIPPGFKPHQFDTNTGTSDMVGWDDQWSVQILAAYGVSKFSVGIDTNVNRATGEATMWVQDKTVILPLTSLIADHITTQLAMPEYGSDFGCFFEEFVAPDKEFELLADESDLKNKVKTINEIREERSLPPVAWGDVPVGSLADSPYTGEEPELLDLGVTTADAAPPIVTKSRAAFFAPETQWVRNVRIDEERMPEWQMQQQRVFEAQLEDSLNRLESATGTDIADRSTSRDIRRVIQLRVSTAEIFIANAWNSLFDDLIEPLREAILMETARITHEALPTELIFEQTAYMVQQIRNQGAEYIANINRTTQRAIQDVLSAAVDSGASVSSIARELTSVFRDPVRNRRIARTEVGMANQAGVIAGYLSSQVVRSKQWNTSLDAAVRDSHQIEGQTVPIDHYFTLRDGVNAYQPLDPRLPPEDLINCRCFVTPVLIDE